MTTYHASPDRQPQRIDTPAGPLAVSVNPALSEYDVEIVHERATERDPKPYTRYAVAGLPRAAEYNAPAEPVTINGVSYDVTITAHEVDGRWIMPTGYDGYPRVSRHPWLGEATDAARRYVRERIVPAVLDWLNSHPDECDDMEAVRLGEVYQAMTERIERAEQAVLALRYYRERVEARRQEVTE
jgi:hypothetical protein